MRQSRRLAVALAAATSLIPLFLVPSASAESPTQQRADHLCGQPVGSARQAHGCITNNTDEDLELVSTELVHGDWASYPPQTIKAHESGSWVGRSHLELTGSHIRARYRTASGWVGNFEVGIVYLGDRCWHSWWLEGGSTDAYAVNTEQEARCAAMIQARFTIDKK
ncbi:hypothetical protein [Streptomyces venezuelae]|uniref:hypothetical protein n=1 Tax=Streptomyces venezuelae TaxID=54571 RepID=UPI003643F9C7